MKRYISIFLGSTLLAACSHVSYQQPLNALSESESTSESSTSSESVAIPRQWQYWRVNNLPFQIALPTEAVMIARNTKYRGYDVKGVNIDAYPTINDPAIWANNSKYFSFMWGKISGFKSLDEFLDSICLPKGRLKEAGYKVFEKWYQDSMEVVFFAPWQCDQEFAAMGRGAVISYQEELFVIFLPPGDWGSEGGKYFNIALHSIRPVNASNSSTSS